MRIVVVFMNRYAAMQQHNEYKTDIECKYLKKGQEDAVNLIQLFHLSTSTILSYGSRQTVKYKIESSSFVDPNSAVSATDMYKRLIP